MSVDAIVSRLKLINEKGDYHSNKKPQNFKIVLLGFEYWFLTCQSVSLPHFLND